MNCIRNLAQEKEIIFLAPSYRARQRLLHGPQTPTFNGRRFLSSTDSQQQQEALSLTVREVRLRDAAAKHNRHVVTVYTADFDDDDDSSSMSWKTIETETSRESSEDQGPILAALQDNVVTYFLPARYPESVAAGYGRYAAYCFCASIAGSAAMVLSTQTLLLAVGVVGSSGHEASVMAGALNWVLKDGIGQLGGVWFASRMSQAGSAKFDADPKRWRMVAALSMDGATLLEIVSPLVPPVWVLPIASVANIGKNIGFLTASASRAALHQSLAIRGNLADVTAKAGSQALAASLFGTVLGIGISPILGDVVHFSLGFVCLSTIHQTCTYLSLKSAPLFNLNRHRLNIILQDYLTTDSILSPAEVAEKESFLPVVSKDKSKQWLSIGAPLTTVCPGGPDELRLLLNVTDQEQYLINLTTGDNKDNNRAMVHLVFQHDADGEDLIRGMLHAHILHRQGCCCSGSSCRPLDSIANSYEEVRRRSEALLEGMKSTGWKTETEFASVESSKARRLTIHQG